MDTRKSETHLDLNLNDGNPKYVKSVCNGKFKDLNLIVTTIHQISIKIMSFLIPCITRPIY